MKALRICVIATLFASGLANATGLPAKIDFSAYFTAWSLGVLKQDGITDARIVESSPLSFTYCRKDSATLWRYNVLSAKQLDALKRGENAEPEPLAQKSEEIERDSKACKAA